MCTGEAKKKKKTRADFFCFFFGGGWVTNEIDTMRLFAEGEGNQGRNTRGYNATLTEHV